MALLRLNKLGYVIASDKDGARSIPSSFCIGNNSCIEKC